jgi:hypothetical protein
MMLRARTSTAPPRGRRTFIAGEKPDRQHSRVNKQISAIDFRGLVGTCWKGVLVLLFEDVYFQGAKRIQNEGLGRPMSRHKARASKGEASVEQGNRTEKKSSNQAQAVRVGVICQAVLLDFAFTLRCLDRATLLCWV